MQNNKDVEVKPIPGKPGYYAADTDQGEVFKVINIKTRKQKNGYVKIDFYVKGKRLTDLMHRVIARTFLKNNLRSIDEVDHIHEDKTLNGTAHIEIVTRAVNLYRRDNGFDKEQGALGEHYKHEEEPF